MFTHKVINIISKFSSHEIRELKDFINSPYFNKSRKITLLFEEITQHHPDYDISRLNNEVLHDALFPHIKYNDATIRHLFSDLFKLTERYLAVRNLEHKKFEFYYGVSEEIETKECFELIDSYLNKMNDALIVESCVGADYFQNNVRMETKKFNFSLQNYLPSDKVNIQKTVQHLTNRNTYLISHFIIEIIRGLDTLNLLAKMYNINVQKNFVNNFLNIFDLNKTIIFLKNSPELAEYEYIFDIYHKMFTAFTKFDHEVFYFEYKAALLKHSSRFSIEQKIYLYKKLADYCLLKKKAGNSVSDFNKELFEVYKLILENGFFMDENSKYLRMEFYRNIFILGLQLMKYDWVENFIITYSEKINPVNRKNLINYSYACLHFEKSEFKKSISYLNKVKLDNFSLKLDVKSLLLRLYYELDYAESAFSLIYTYKSFLRKQENLSPERKRSHLNFIKCAYRMISLETNYDYMKLADLKKNISNEKQIINKDWLIKNINKLESSKLR